MSAVSPSKRSLTRTAYELLERVTVNSTPVSISSALNQVPRSRSRFGFCFDLPVAFTGGAEKRLTFNELRNRVRSQPDSFALAVSLAKTVWVSNPNRRE